MFISGNILLNSLQIPQTASSILLFLPRRATARQDDHLAGFPRRAIMDAVHGWEIPSPSSKLPVDE
jgi:hypothetical protein